MFLNRDSKDAGAAAVEFALLLFPVLLLLMGLIQYGFLLNAKISVTHAAHEGARFSAFGEAEPVVIDRVQVTGAPTVNILDGEVNFDPSNCEVNVAHNFPTPLLGIIGVAEIEVNGTGVESCI